MGYFPEKEREEKRGERGGVGEAFVVEVMGKVGYMKEVGVGNSGWRGRSDLILPSTWLRSRNYSTLLFLRGQTLTCIK